jgi:hypothetical protein
MTMPSFILIAVASLFFGCAHQQSPGSSAPLSGGSQTSPATSMPGELSPAMKAQKRECEKLLNAVLPSAERLLSKHRELYPFAIALTSNGQVISTTRSNADRRPRSGNAVAVLEKGLQQGAESGRYKATALVLDMMVVPPRRGVQQHAIAIQLDHRGGYSVIVFYPYDLGESGSLAIGAPFSEWGEQKIFAR